MLLCLEQRVEQIKKCQLNESLNESQIQAIAKAVEAKDLAIVQGVGNNSSDAIILSHFLYLTVIFWQKIERNIWIFNLAELAKFVFILNHKFRQ